MIFTPLFLRNYTANHHPEIRVYAYGSDHSDGLPIGSGIPRLMPEVFSGPGLVSKVKPGGRCTEVHVAGPGPAVLYRTDILSQIKFS